MIRTLIHVWPCGRTLDTFALYLTTFINTTWFENDSQKKKLGLRALKQYLLLKKKMGSRGLGFDTTEWSIAKW